MFSHRWFFYVLSSAILSAWCWASSGMAEPGATTSSLPEIVTALEKTLTASIEKAEKSVVAIARVRKEQRSEIFQLEIKTDPFGRRPEPSSPIDPTDPGFIPNEYATGVVIDSSGLILTTCDILGDNSDYYITTAQRKVYKAVVKASDQRSDLALLKIDAVDMVPIVFGNAVELKKGQIVINLGNPYAIARDGQAVAAWGIVANLARKAPLSNIDSTEPRTLHHYGTLIQTDARLNRGTSGGPLLNLQGEMIGLCIAAVSVNGYETAGSYAIPVDDTFRRVVHSLLQGKEVEYGFLGVQPTNLSQQEIQNGLHGAKIVKITSGSAAEHVGLKPGDIIMAVNQTTIHNADELILNIGRLPAGEAVKLTVLRNNRPITITVTLGKYTERKR